MDPGIPRQTLFNITEHLSQRDENTLSQTLSRQGTF